MSSLESQQYDDVTIELEGFMSVQKKAMFYLGYWPVKNEPHNMLYYWRYYFPRVIMCYILTCAISQNLLDIFFSSNNLLFVFEQTIIISIFVYLIGTLWTVISKMDDHKELALIIQEMNEDKRLTDDFQRSLSRETQKFCHYSTLFCDYLLFPAMTSLVGLYFLLVYLGRHPPRLTFYRAYYPYDVTAFPNYELTMAMQALNVTLFFVCVQTYDTFMLTVFIHIITQFKILNHKLKELRTHAERNVRMNDWMTAMPSITQTVLQSHLKNRRYYGRKCRDIFTDNVHLEMRRLLEECMEQHKQLLSIVKSVAEISHLKLSILTGWNLTGIIIYAIHIDMAPGFDLKQFLSLYLLFLSLYALLVYSVLSTEISHESSLVGESLYSCDWFDAPEDFKRDMRIFMTTVSQPAEIVVLKFVPLSLDTFQSVVDTAYSYYMVMNEVTH